jgi:glycosyltransferase involved in cell wall biosynthesis
MLSLLDYKGRIAHAARRAINTLQLHFSSYVRKAAGKARIVLAQTTKDKYNFDRLFGIDSVVAHEQACDLSVSKLRSFDGERKLNIAWVGRCISLKNLPILLSALSKSNIKDKVVLHIAGDGPNRKKWEKLAGKLQVGNCCRWYGWLPQDETIELLDSCDLLAFTSLLEGTNATVMQALSLGLPVICFKHCGFGDVVDNSCGITIAVTNPQQAANDLTLAIESVFDDPLSIAKMSKAAACKAEENSWDQLALCIKRSYEKQLKSPQRSYTPDAPASSDSDVCSDEILSCVGM